MLTVMFRTLLLYLSTTKYHFLTKSTVSITVLESSVYETFISQTGTVPVEAISQEQSSTTGIILHVVYI